MILSGQTIVPQAGTAVPLGSLTVNGALQIKALESNAGIVAVGNDGAGDVTLSNGLRLAPGETCFLEFIGNLASIWLDAAINGEGVAWLVLEA